MGIEAVNIKGTSVADVICDCCGHKEQHRCQYQGTFPNAKPNVGQVLRRICPMGWQQVKNKLHCPSCAAERKKPKPKGKPMSPSTTPPKKPDGKQKRLIIMMLEEAYDDAKQRYKDDHTDATIARDCGKGFMPGWVAEIREAMFGPEGNEEVELIKKEIAALKRDWENDLQVVDKKYQLKFERLNKTVDELTASFDKRVKA